MNLASGAGLTGMTEPQTQTLETPGAVLAYDVRPGSSAVPPLLLIGSPMGAAGFGTLAAHFRDRTVVTYDPRGAERSRRTDGATETTPEEHADDLSRLIATLGAGPVDVFASSGGAVNALVLVARQDQVFPWQGPAWVGEHLPGAETVFCENSSHALFLDEPGKVNRVVADFHNQGH